MQRVVIIALFTVDAALGQQPPAQPVFDVASVKPDRSGTGAWDVEQHGGLLVMTNVSLKYCLALAYDVREPQVAGPAWLDGERYDINAKVVVEGFDRQYALRLQALLTDRFKLRLHREMRETPVYEMVVAKGGLKIRKEGAVAAEGAGSSSHQRGTAAFRTVTMAQLAKFLERSTDRPVIDTTGLDGVYSFALEWNPEERLGVSPAEREPVAAGDERPSIFVALEQQLGLKLEARKAPVEVIVVDSADKVPTEN